MKKLGFGLMRLPLVNPDNQKEIDYEAMGAMVDDFMAHGFTHYDTAFIYHGGKSEVAFRDLVVKKYPRDQFTITDKMPMFIVKSEENLEEIFQKQMDRCGVDFFDYYWLHALNAGSYKRSVRYNAFQFIEEKKAKGLIKHIGISFHDSAAVLEQILTEHPEIEFVQLQLNYLDWEDENIQSRKCYETAVKHGKKVMVMEPLKGGALVNVPEEVEKLFKEANPDLSVASWAMRFAASLDEVVCVLSGMGEQWQLDDNISYMDDFKPLTEAEHEVIKKAAEIIRASIAIPCTACHYCTDGCPKNIVIPEYFAVYNNMKRFSDGSQDLATLNYFSSIMRGHGKPSECIECGQCEEHCPQKLPIIQHLKEVAEALEN